MKYCCWWFRNPKQPPFGCIKTPEKNHGRFFYHINWCRISSINGTDWFIGIFIRACYNPYITGWYNQIYSEAHSNYSLRFKFSECDTPSKTNCWNRKNGGWMVQMIYSLFQFFNWGPGWLGRFQRTIFSIRIKHCFFFFLFFRGSTPPKYGKPLPLRTIEAVIFHNIPPG